MEIMSADRVITVILLATPHVSHCLQELATIIEIVQNHRSALNLLMLVGAVAVSTVNLITIATRTRYVISITFSIYACQSNV